MGKKDRGSPKTHTGTDGHLSGVKLTLDVRYSNSDTADSYGGEVRS